MKKDSDFRGFLFRKHVILLIALFLFFQLNTCSLDKYTLVEPGLEQQIAFSPSLGYYNSGTYPSVTISISYTGTVDPEIQIRYNITSSPISYPADPATPTWDSGNLYNPAVPLVQSTPPMYYKINAIAYKIVGGNARYSAAKIYPFYHGSALIAGGLNKPDGTILPYTGETVGLYNPDTNYTYKYTITHDNTEPVDPNDDGSNAIELGHAEILTLPDGAPVKIKLRAYRTGFLPSGIQEYNYPRKLTAPAFNPPDGAVLTVGSPTVTLTNRLPGATYYYTSAVNGTPPDPTTSSAVLTGDTINITDSTTTIKIFCVKTNYNNSDIVTLNYKLRVPDPVIAGPSTGGVWFGQTRSVTMNQGAGAPAGAEIRYTAAVSPGTPADPATSDSLYSAPVSLDRSMNYNFRAFKANWEPSGVIPANYTVKNVYTAVYSGGTVKIYRDQTVITSFSGVFSVSDIHVKNGYIFVCGDVDINSSYLYIYPNGGPGNFCGLADATDARAVYYDGSNVYVLYKRMSNGKWTVDKLNTSGGSSNKWEVTADTWTVEEAYDLIYLSDSQLYVSARVSSAGNYKPVITNLLGSQNTYDLSTASGNASVYAGRMVYDGSMYLHVIGRGTGGNTYWSVNSDLSGSTSNTSASSEFVDISRGTDGTIRILGNNGGTHSAYDTSLNPVGVGILYTSSNIRVVNSANWAINAMVGGTPYVYYSYDGGGNYQTYPLSAGSSSAMDIGEYVN